MGMRMEGVYPIGHIAGTIDARDDELDLRQRIMKLRWLGLDPEADTLGTRIGRSWHDARPTIPIAARETD